MIRLNSPNIDDFKSMKIFYWDSSFLLINGGKPVGIKIPTEVMVEWLDTRVDAEKDLAEWSKKLDLEKEWGTITVPNPTQYPNINLFFVGHIDSDMIKEVEILPDPATDKLTESFMKLGNLRTAANIGSDKVPEVLMATKNPATVLKNTGTGTSQLDQSGVKTTDDIEKSMTNKVIDTLHLDSRSAKYHLSNEDMHKYTGVEKSNPKSFQSGSNVGFIDLNTVTNEVLFTQIRMLREVIFDVIPRSRYDHLVRN